MVAKHMAFNSRSIAGICLLLGQSVAMSGPTGGTVISGAASIDIDPLDATRTIITQSSQNTSINWNSFNINTNESVVFAQPNGNAIALNRDFSGSPSQIFGLGMNTG